MSIYIYTPMVFLFGILIITSKQFDINIIRTRLELNNKNNKQYEQTRVIYGIVYI